MLTSLIGYLAATLTTAAFLPQAIKTIRSRDTRGLSLPMYLIFAAGVICWLAYGVLIGSWPVILANIATLILVSGILFVLLKHQAGKY